MTTAAQPPSDTPTAVDRLMKRCQVGVGGRNALNAAHDIMAECYGTLGRLQGDLAAAQATIARQAEELERVRKDAARWKWWRTNRPVSLITTLFGNGCINRSAEEAEEFIDSALAAAEKEPAK